MLAKVWRQRTPRFLTRVANKQALTFAAIQALAKEAGANFINIRASTLQSKWFGETQKLTHAVFTLAYKLQPCIIFIGGTPSPAALDVRLRKRRGNWKRCADEAEAILGKRRDSEHEVMSSMKTEFMQLWDGFNTDPEANVMVLAATNRPFSLDDAVLRRCRPQCCDPRIHDKHDVGVDIEAFFTGNSTVPRENPDRRRLAQPCWP